MDVMGGCSFLRGLPLHPSTSAAVGLGRRSSKAVHEPATERAVWWRWAPPDPGTGAGIELVRRKTRGDGQVLVIGEVLAREGVTPKEAPPACGQVDPRGAHRDRDWAHPRGR